MKGKEMFRQTSARKANAQTQARQPNKQMVEVEADASCPRSKKHFKQQRQRQQRSPNLSRIEFHSFCLSEIPQTEQVRQRRNSKKFYKLAVA